MPYKSRQRRDPRQELQWQAAWTAAWEVADALDIEDVAEALRLEPETRRAHGWECPRCGDTTRGACRAIGPVLHCHRCGESWGAVRLTVEVRGGQRMDALRWLAGMFGIALPGAAVTVGVGTPPDPRPTRPRRPNRSESLDAELQVRREAGEAAATPAGIYAFLSELLPLAGPAASHLAGRGLDVAAAAVAGFRGVDGPEHWAHIGEALRDRFDLVELERAGLYPAPETVAERGDAWAARPRAGLPWGGRHPALLIPYVVDGTLHTVRFRAVAPDVAKEDRYRSLRFNHPQSPFGIDALAGAPGAVVHVTEGDLNAWTLLQVGELAVGLPGAGQPWRPDWVQRLAGADRVWSWFDANDAGDAGAHRAGAALSAAFGPEWVAERVRHLRVHHDANDLHQRDALRPLLDELTAHVAPR